METLIAHSHNSTKLIDRTLWFDGDSTVAVDYILNSITSGKNISGLFVENLTEEIIQYNSLVSKPEQIKSKSEMSDLIFNWELPIEYKKLDVVSYVADKLQQQCESDTDFLQKQIRCADELSLYKELNLLDTIRCLIYIINTLIENNVVWGVGRGSSVSSYVLYVIGVHDVDSYHYNLDITEFLRTNIT